MGPVYTAVVTASGDGRRGHVASSDGNFEATLVSPTEMGGTGEPGTNPEQLFAGGYAACFHSALRYIARTENTPLDHSEVTATVSLVKNEDGRFTLRVLLQVHVPDMAFSAVARLTAAADRVCPYSNACRGDADVEVRAVN